MAALTQAIDAIATPLARGASLMHCVGCGQEQDVGRPVVRAAPPGRPFDLHRCEACGLVQQHPRWSAARITNLYDDEYYVFAEREEHRWGRAVQKYAVHLARYEASEVGAPSRTEGRGGGLRLLDVGCALGHLAILAKRRGWRVTGIDISAGAVSQAAVRFGLDFRAGSLSSHAGTMLPFDVVLLGDVIEHVPDPARLLCEVRKVLTSGGRVCIDTPNWGGFWRRWGRSSWLGLNRFHINLFDVDSLGRLLAACGFCDIQAASGTHYRYEGWAARPEVRSVIQKLPSFLAWRIVRFLENRRPRTAWSPLRDHPPQTLDDACHAVDELTASSDILQAGVNGDNLIVTARR